MSESNPTKAEHLLMVHVLRPDWLFTEESYPEKVCKIETMQRRG